MSILWIACPAWAERELHVVSVNQGWVAPGDFRNEPQARVIVDRPGSEVILVLLDADKVEWMVETTPGSFIETILLGGDRSRRSRVDLDGIRLSNPHVPALTHVNKPLGRHFRALLSQLSLITGLDRIASFQFAYVALSAGHRVDRFDQGKETLVLDYLPARLGPAQDLPPALQSWLEGARPEAHHDASFSDTAMTLTDADGTRVFPVPPGIPIPHLASGACFDPVDEMLYGISIGGQGHLYAVNTRTGAWQVLTSLNGYDGAEVFFDRTGDQFILTGAFSRPGDIRVIARDGRAETIRMGFLRFPGLSDLYDYENEPAPSLRPRAYQDGWLLLEAIEDRDQARARQRLYAVHLATEEIRLLKYSGR